MSEVRLVLFFHPSDSQSPSPLVFLFPALFALGILLPACSRGPTPEEQHADALLEQGRDALAKHQYSEGIGFLHEALSTDAENSRRAQQAAEESESLGDIYTTTAQYDSAFSLYEQSYGRYKLLGEKSSALRLRLNTAYLHRWMGQEETAFEMYSGMLRIARVLGDTEGLTEIEWAMLPSCRVLDKRELETALLTDLLDKSTSEKEAGQQARVYFEWGLSHAYRSEDQSAVENFLRAIALADQARDSIMAISSLARLAMVYAHQGNTNGAFQAYTDGLTKADKSPGAGNLRKEMLVRVGNIYLGNRQFAEADRFYRAAFLSASNGGDRLMEGYMLLQLGHCASGLGRRDVALKNYQLALDLFSSYSYEPGITYALMSLGIAASATGHLNDALAYFTKAVEHHDVAPVLRADDDLTAECEEVFLKGYQKSPHEALAEVLLSVGKYDEAFLQAELQKGESLYDALGQFRFDGGEGQITSALREFQENKSLTTGALRQLGQMLSGDSQDRFLLDQLQANLKRYKEATDHAAERVLALSSGLAPIVRRGSISIADVQKALAPGAILLEPIPTSRSLYLFAIGNSRWSVQLAPVERSRFTGIAMQYNQILSAQSAFPDSATLQNRDAMRQFGSLGASLYDALIRPVESQLVGATKLIVVPPEPLVPFQSLQKGGSRKGNPYLIQQYSLQYLPSAATLSLPVLKRGTGSNIVGLGHAGTTDWDVEYELRDIRAFSKDAELYFRTQASLATLQKLSGTVLHLATELHYDDRVPGNSYLVLSDGQSDATTTSMSWGSLLSLQHFSTIILSDLGKYETIPAVKPEMFLMKGGETVILTIYPAHRKTKKYFGEMFYTAYTSGNSVQDSYRQAMLGMIGNAEYAAPYLWAPFFLYGR